VEVVLHELANQVNVFTLAFLPEFLLAVERTDHRVDNVESASGGIEVEQEPMGRFDVYWNYDISTSS